MAIMKWLRMEWDRVGAWLLVAIGALMLILGWVGVSGTPYTAKQLPYLISGGVGGLFLLGLGAMLWLSADMRDEWRQLDQIRQELSVGSANRSASLRSIGSLPSDGQRTDELG
ncbi:MAG TPA: hypothetical protein VHV57_03860 [Acidimicrobiales bacterium]|jgi:hypothetical protein|nr:hypothetical protein [Acidimicrobiales bacterium]